MPSQVPTAKQALSVSAVVARRPKELRHLPALWKTIGRSPLQLGIPWLPFSAIEFLGQSVDSDCQVFEFGGGGSTVWMAERAGRIFTVEHDPSWADLLQSAVATCSNVELLMRSGENDFEEYVTSIDAFAENSFDLVLVDGRRRARCVEHSISKVRPGGFLLLDDSDRSRYESVHRMLATWESRTFRGLSPCSAGGKSTTIWTKRL